MWYETSKTYQWAKVSNEEEEEVEEEEEGIFLFNDALNTFYLRLYGVGHNMVKDHSDSERGNPGYYFLLIARVLFLCIIPQTSCGTRNSSMGPP